MWSDLPNRSVCMPRPGRSHRRELVRETEGTVRFQTVPCLDCRLCLAYDWGVDVGTTQANSLRSLALNHYTNNGVALTVAQ